MSIFTLLNFISRDSFKVLHILIIVIAITALSCAYYAEYIMHLQPCSLCVYQRFPYLYLIKISLVGLLVKKISKYSLIFTSVTLVVASLIAGYHTGIERKFFEPSSFCSSKIRIPEHLAISDIKKMLYNEPIVSCAEVAWRILGLSMTEWNLVLNLGLLALVLLAWWYQKRISYKEKFHA